MAKAFGQYVIRVDEQEDNESLMDEFLAHPAIQDFMLELREHFLGMAERDGRLDLSRVVAESLGWGYVHGIRSAAAIVRDVEAAAEEVSKN